jgi:aryl-alcohol dehydrogenase-like predicted oxidoreductase
LSLCIFLSGNQAKLTAVEELIKVAADAGCSLTHLALAFVTAHQAVTSAIIGPRTMDHSPTCWRARA